MDPQFTVVSIKDGLRRCVKGENVSAADLGLPESESRLFRLIKALLRFALDYEVGLNALLFQFSIGVSSKFDTQLQQGFQRIVKDRFAACLDNEEGSLEKLKERELELSVRFNELSEIIPLAILNLLSAIIQL